MRSCLIAPMLAVALFAGGKTRLAVSPLIPANGLAQVSETTVVRAGQPLHPRLGRTTVELTIGKLEGPAEYLFAEVSEIALGLDGSVFIVDAVLRGNDSRVLQFDREGRFLRRIGRRGQGPGEFIGPKGIRQFRDGRIALRDNSNGRINIYSRSGTPAETWRFGRVNTPEGPAALVTDTAGFLYLAAVGSREFEGLIRYARGGVVVDSLPAPEPGRAALAARPTLPVRNALTGRVNRGPVPFVPRPFVVWSPLGYWVAGYPSTYAFDMYLPGAARGVPARPVGGGQSRPVQQWKPGDRILRITRDIPPVVVSAAEREERRRIREASARLADPDFRWNGSEIPRTKPAYRSIMVAADGRVWVQLSATAVQVDSARGIHAPTFPGRVSRIPVQRWIERNIWDVFGPDGRYHGQVELPLGVTLQTIIGDTLWVSGTDADDAPIAQRLRVVWQ